MIAPSALPRSLRSLSLLPLVLAPALCLAFSAGCSSGGGDSNNGGGASMSGRVTVPAQGGTVLEAEPNDSVDQTFSLGSLGSGQSLAVVGSVGGTDPLDGFSVRASERVLVSFQLEFDAAEDLDLLVYDPVSMQFVQFFVSATQPESGSFYANGSFDLVVLPFMASSSSYTLTLDVSAVAQVLESEPNDGCNAANGTYDGEFVGEFGAGDSLVFQGSADAATDPVDRFLVAFPAALQLDLSLAMPGGADFDLFVRDQTGGIFDAGGACNPPPLVDSFESMSNPETGSINVPGMSLYEVEVFAFVGSGAYTLTLGGAAPPPGSGFAGLAATQASPAPLASERAALGELRYGRPLHETWPGEVVVATNSSLAASGFEGALAQRGCRELARAGADGARLLAFELDENLDAVERARATLARTRSLASHPAVAYAEPNFVWRPMGGTLPNDPFYNLQWHYPQIQLPAAWGLTTGSNDVIVGVIDTGEIAHPDLVARQIAGYDLITSPQIAGDGDGQDPDPTDVGDGNGLQPSSFHGAHVAGTVGADTDNQLGVSGVTWATRLMHLRALGIGGGSTFDIANAVLYGARLANSTGNLPAEAADILNMSLGGGGSSQMCQNAINNAVAAGTTVFAAAGNENSSSPSFPAAYNNVISVSAVDYNANRAPYSNFHPTVDVAAPGGNTGADVNGDSYADGVLSTLADDSSSPTVFNFGFYQGTSMACPHAAGVAALMLAVDPGLTPAEIEQMLESTANDLGAPGQDNIYGAGLINAFQAVQLAMGGGGGMPVLGLSVSSLVGNGAGTQSVAVSNLGGGMLSVTALNVSTATGSWLSAQAVPAGTSTSTDTGWITVTTDPTGLADGLYQGSVEVVSNGGSRTLAVTLSVGDEPTVVDVDIFVLVVDAVSFETLAQRIVNPTRVLDYSISGLPAGNYLLVAGSDDDNDGFICGDQDVYCSLYPTLDQPQVISVSEGQTLTGLDLTMQTGFGGQSAGSDSSGSRVFSLLD